MPCFQHALAFVAEARSFVRGRLPHLTKPDLQYEPSSKNKILLFFIYLLHHLPT
jgi:hypothetical protein